MERVNHSCGTTRESLDVDYKDIISNKLVKKRLQRLAPYFVASGTEMESVNR